jgi:release factor glutamine methyltransferase
MSPPGHSNGESPSAQRDGGPVAPSGHPASDARAAQRASGPPVTAAQLLTESGLPRLEARALLAQVLSLPRERLVADPQQAVAAAAAQRFDALAQRRREGEPLAYLLGSREFYGRPFTVTPDVLVPRPETETLVDCALAALRALPTTAAPRVLDLGTGSGCIAITLALEWPGAEVTAVDLSETALAVAASNARALGATLTLRAGDWYTALDADHSAKRGAAGADHAAGDPRFDLIVANPPYIAAGDPHLPALRHEPLRALTDGADGLDCLRAIAQQAPRWLRPGGTLLLEHGYDQRAAVDALLRNAGFADVQAVSDAAGIVRVAVGRLTNRAGVRPV